MAGRLPAEFIDQILSRTDIVELIDRRVSLRRAGRDYTACCPFHAEKTPSFTVSPDKQFYHCFGCGAHGNAIRFLIEYERLEFIEAVEELARDAGLEMPRSGFTPDRQIADRQQRLRAAHEAAAAFYQQRLERDSSAQKVRDYLAKRGIALPTAQKFGLGYAPAAWDALLQHLSQHFNSEFLIEAGLAAPRRQGPGSYDRFRDRLMFPIRDRRGRCIAFGGRALGDDADPKYLNSPETPLFDKRRTLYGLPEMRQAVRQPQQLLLVEGYMDVLALHQHGLANAVAALGTATTTEHLEQAFRLCRQVVFCFDGDRAGRAAAHKAMLTALPQLREGVQVAFLFMPEGEDPDSLLHSKGREAIDAQLEHAMPLSDYFFRQLATEYDMGTLDGRAAMAHAARPLIRQIPAGDFRDMMGARLAREARLVGSAISGERDRQPATARRLRSGNDLLRDPWTTALGLLLQHPALALRIEWPHGLQPLHADAPQQQLLIDVLELIHQKPSIRHMAALMAYYQEHEYHHLLEELARWQPLLDITEREKEFDAVMQRLRALADPQRLALQRLIELGDLDELSEEDQAILRQGKTDLLQ